MIYERIVVRRYSKETGEVAEKIYFNMTTRQAEAHFNRMKIGKTFGSAVTIAAYYGGHGPFFINTIGGNNEQS